MKNYLNDPRIELVVGDDLRLTVRLREFHNDLSYERWEDKLREVSTKFISKYRIASGTEILTKMRSIYLAHLQRVKGLSNPAACDKTFETIIKTIREGT